MPLTNFLWFLELLFSNCSRFSSPTISERSCFLYLSSVIRFSKNDFLKELRSLKTEQETSPCFLLRKEVIHPHVPVGIPCYDLTPVIDPTFDGFLLAVGPPASGIINSHGLTGGVYKARERIHRGMLIRDY